jgi:ABC-type uncharacterized transport system permease subunit
MAKFLLKIKSFIDMLRLQRKESVKPWILISMKIVSVVIAFLFIGLFILLNGLSVKDIAVRSFESTIGSSFGLQHIAILATPLILTGLACAICIKMRLWNIGAEGHLFMGAWAATAIGLNLKCSPWVAFLMMFLAGALVGALWMLLPALARVFWDVNEIITTLMLNFVAILLVNYFAMDIWKDPIVLDSSRRIPYELSKLWGSMNIGIVIAFCLAVLLAFFLNKTNFGYEIKLIGWNRRASEYIGLPVRKNMLIVMLIAGAIAGIAGVVEVTGTIHRLNGALSNRYGYLGIIIAVVASSDMIGSLFVGTLFSIIINIGIVLKTQGLSSNIVVLSTGLILLLVAIGDMLTRYRVIWRPFNQNAKIKEIRSESDSRI